MHIWMSENNKKREGELMIITKDVLKNLKLKKGEISEKRCQEINAMKIKNPYYPLPAFSCESEYFAVTSNYFAHSEDERIVYKNAFCPLLIWERESTESFPHIYVLIIDDEWFKLKFDYIDQKDTYVNNICIEEMTYKLIADAKFDNRPDKDEIVYLIEEMDIFAYSGIAYKNREKRLNLEYKVELYKWKHWNE